MQPPSRAILIVDDSLADRELYRRYLQQDRDYSYRILEASLGRQGLELWQQQQPDLVLLDYSLPDMNGLEFLAQLSSATPHPCFPVVVMARQGNETIAVRAMKAGAQDYLVKQQITPEVLQLAVNGAIETVQIRTELQQRIELERVFGQLTQQIHQSLELDDILQTTVTEVRQFLNTDRVLVFQLQPDGNGTVVAESVGEAWRSLLSSTIYDPCLAEHYLRFSRSGSITYDSKFVEDYVKRYRQGQITAIPDIHASDIDPCHVELLAQFQVRANLVVPILYDDRFWGLLIAHHCTAPRQWQSLEIDLLKQLATPLGIALRQAELYQQSRMELAERNRIETELRENEQHYATLSQIAPVGIFRTDVHGDCLYTNARWCEITGLSPEAAQGKGWVRALHPDDRDRVFAEWYRATELNQPFNSEYRFQTTAGRVSWVLGQVTAERDSEGNLIGYVGTIANISDRKQTEEMVQRAAERDAFRVALSDALRSPSDPVEIQATACRLLCKYLGANRVAYFQIRGTDYSIEHDYVNGAEPLRGGYAIDSFGHRLLAAYRAGQAVCVADVAADPNLSPAQRSAYAAIQIAAHIGIPLVKNGEFVAGLAIHSTTPRAWTSEEVLLTEEVAERTWAAVERARVETALRASHDTFRHLVENSPFGVYAVDADFRLTQVSAGAQKTFANVRPLLGRDFAEVLRILWSEPFASEAIARFRHTLETGEPYHAPSTVERRHDTDEIESYDWKIERITLPDERFGVVCHYYDLSERLHYEVALRESEERFRNLADHMSQLAWMADEQGWIFWYNRRWFEYTGTTLEEMQGRGWQAVHHPDCVDRVVQHIRHCFATGEVWEDTFPLRGKDGQYRWFLSRAIPIRDEESGKILRWFGTNTDITERQQAEQERQQLLQRERAARAEAERANRIKDEFLAILSHELRSPLNPILGWTKLLQSRKLDPAKTAEALATIERNAKLQAQLIDDLLDVAKILRGKIVMNVAPVDLVFAIEAAIDTVAAAAVAKEIILSSVLPQIGQVSGDIARLQQIIWNLLSNAIKFTPAKGQVEIRLEREGDRAKIIVRDTGKGINREFLPYIFESFRQEDASTTRQYGGLGLGLAIVHHLVEAHGVQGATSAPKAREGEVYSL